MPLTKKSASDIVKPYQTVSRNGKKIAVLDDGTEYELINHFDAAREKLLAFYRQNESTISEKHFGKYFLSVIEDHIVREESGN